MEEETQRTKYLIALVLIIGAVAIVGIITMQLLAAALVILLIMGVTFIFVGIRTAQNKKLTSGLETMDEGTMVIAAAIIVFVGMVTSFWLLWLVAFVFLFQIQQSMARVEKRFDILEKRDLAPTHSPEEKK